MKTWLTCAAKLKHYPEVKKADKEEKTKLIVEHSKSTKW
jgi:hypothetical protein